MKTNKLQLRFDISSKGKKTAKNRVLNFLKRLESNRKAKRCSPSPCWSAELEPSRAQSGHLQLRLGLQLEITHRPGLGPPGLSWVRTQPPRSLGVCESFKSPTAMYPPPPDSTPDFPVCVQVAGKVCKAPTVERGQNKGRPVSKPSARQAETHPGPVSTDLHCPSSCPQWQAAVLRAEEAKTPSYRNEGPQGSTPGCFRFLLVFSCKGWTL